MDFTTQFSETVSAVQKNEFLNLTNATFSSQGDDRSLGAFILDSIDTILSAIGFICNATALCAFLRNGQTFGYPIRDLLIHQAFLDMMTCLIGFIIHCQPSYWHVKNYYWEVLNCYLWHSQYFFWYFLYTSANNLVYLAYDRYRAVVHPLHYKDISKTRVNVGFALTHIYTILVRWPIFLWIRMNGDECEAGWVIKGKWGEITSNMYGVFEFIVHYLIPMIALIFFYGKVIKSSKKALQQQDRTTSAATQKALSVVTKAAIAVTAVFILTFSWIFWNYTPGVLFGWFEIGHPLQKTNVLAGGINSACNPAFYCLFMPSFRRALIKTFFPCLEKEGKRDADNCSDNSSRTGTSSSNLSIPAAHIQ